MYTQCPHCHTVFRVGPDQLTVAEGRVRCGQCHAVFDALLALSEQLPQTPAAIPPSPSPGREPAEPSIQRWDIDEIEISAYPENFTLDQSSSRPAADGKHAAGTTPAAHGDPQRAEPLISGNTAPESQDEVIVVHHDEAAAAVTPAPAPPSRRGQDDEVPLLLQEDLARLQGTHAEAPSVWTIAAWSAGILALLFLLIAQYGYFMRDSLAGYPPLRPWLEKLCAAAHCTIPPLRDVAKITLLSRDVRSHPTIKGALLITATLVNRAAFAQPFPILQISFSDLAGKVIALRRFRPVEYLGKDADLRRGMPPGKRIHVVMAVMDPGRQAVTFRFDFL
ncbi:MAG: DUF3426 domain-containing protein [Gammaproteobacteria bacterium]|nr:DUF3426 domain-containing protein [Gammaproteobacteria bacterium]